MVYGYASGDKGGWGRGNNPPGPLLATQIEQDGTAAAMDSSEKQRSTADPQEVSVFALGMVRYCAVDLPGRGASSCGKGTQCRDRQIPPQPEQPGQRSKEI
jgi:hypothetical protein